MNVHNQNERTVYTVYSNKLFGALTKTFNRVLNGNLLRTLLKLGTRTVRPLLRKILREMLQN